MKKFIISFLIFIAIFTLLELDIYTKYKTNSEIEKAPIEAIATFIDAKKFEGYTSRRGNKYNDSYKLKYSFNVKNRAYYGSTSSLLSHKQVNEFLMIGTIKIVYFANNPTVNTPKSYYDTIYNISAFRDFFQTSSINLLISLIFALFILTLMFLKSWIQKKVKFKI